MLLPMKDRYAPLDKGHKYLYIPVKMKNTEKLESNHFKSLISFIVR